MDHMLNKNEISFQLKCVEDFNSINNVYINFT